MSKTPTGTPTKSAENQHPRAIVCSDTANLSLQPYNSSRPNYSIGPLNGSFLSGSPYSSEAGAYFRGNYLRGDIRDEVMYPQRSASFISMRFTLSENALRWGFNGGAHLTHERLALPSDEAANIQQAGVRYQLKQVQAAGTVRFAYDAGTLKVGKPLEITLKSGHFLPPDLQAGSLGQNLYLARFVKAWLALHGHASHQLVGVSLKDCNGHILGYLDADLVKALLAVQDDSFNVASVSQDAGVFPPIGQELHSKSTSAGVSTSVAASTAMRPLQGNVSGSRRSLFGDPFAQPGKEVRSHCRQHQRASPFAPVQARRNEPPTPTAALYTPSKL